MNLREKSFSTLLAETLLSAEKLYTEQKSLGQKSGTKKEWRFSAAEFFGKWFREYGSAYFFLFRKNLKVTNIQFAELLALVRSFNRSIETGQAIRNLQFLTPQEFTKALTEVVGSFNVNKANGLERYLVISKLYYSIISRHVIVEPFYGSCAVFVPPNLHIDTELICAHSGYIHSCGINIFTRKIEKSKRRELFRALDRHLTHPETKTESPFFIVYAHEDFTRTERPEKKEYLRDGLDEVKIFIEKFYMDSERLIDVVEEMKDKYRGRLLFHSDGQGPSDAIRKALRENIPFDHTRTIWLLVDHSVSTKIKNWGEDRYYICYEQHYVNENPFQFFDENKPAWFSHTTIPHTLLSAMINLTGAPNPKQEIVLADPFAGTGTTWLEAIKLDRVRTICTDRAPRFRHGWRKTI